jgi:hypothetical protein
MGSAMAADISVMVVKLQRLGRLNQEIDRRDARRKCSRRLLRDEVPAGWGLVAAAKKE